jgi:hypothetical protein
MMRQIEVTKESSEDARAAFKHQRLVQSTTEEFVREVARPEVGGRLRYCSSWYCRCH